MVHELVPPQARQSGASPPNLSRRDTATATTATKINQGCRPRSQTHLAHRRRHHRNARQRSQALPRLPISKASCPKPMQGEPRSANCSHGRGATIVSTNAGLLLEGRGTMLPPVLRFVNNTAGLRGHCPEKEAQMPPSPVWALPGVDSPW
jgi:hypothetical protein